MNSIQTNQLKYIGKIIAFALLYFIAARLGFFSRFNGEIPTLIWPASAFSLAVLLIFGLEMWPGISIGALMVAISNNHSFALTLTIIVTHTMEPVVGAYLIRRVSDFNIALERPRDVFTFIGFGAIIGPAVGATLGVISFYLSPEGQMKNFTALWLQWWLAHAFSVIIITPVILTWWSNPHLDLPQKRLLEAIFVFGALLLVSFLVFLRLPVRNLPLGHVLFPFLLWLALRFGPREVAMGSFLASIIAILGTVNSTGPFSRPVLGLNLILLMTFIGSVMITALLISTVMMERRRDREALQHSHDLLERRVAERTVELSKANQLLTLEIEERKEVEEKLALAHDQALEALLLKSQILANVSHDARTPLNIILLYAELLQNQRYGPLQQRQLDALDVILNGTKELEGFINNLLDEAQLQAQKEAPPWSDVEIQEWFDQTTIPLRQLAERKGLQMKTAVADDLPTHIQTDSESLRQIVNNLTWNAIKFTDEGMISIRLNSVEASKWALEVADTGMGIPQEAQSQIYEAFWQVDGSATRKVTRGVGLGLSIVKRRVELLNGEIYLESKPGEGAIFTVVMPLVNEEKVVTNEP